MTSKEKIKNDLRQIGFNLLKIFLTVAPMILIIHLVTGASINISGKCVLWIFVMWVGEGVVKGFNQEFQKQSESKKDTQQ